jgi:hypothetical protein
MPAEDSKASERFSLSRWSRRKRDAARSAPDAPAVADAAPATAVAAQAPAAVASGDAAATHGPAAAAAPVSAAPAVPEALPPVDSLTFDSDFAAFMQPKVDEGTKRAALKKLFSNEHFNVMDGLDIYVGDYTQPDPMPEGMLDKLANVYEAIKPFDDAPAAADAALAPPVAAEPSTCDTASPPAAEATPPDAGVPAPPPAVAEEAPPPIEAADDTATVVAAPGPAAAPRSA